MQHSARPLVAPHDASATNTVPRASAELRERAIAPTLALVADVAADEDASEGIPAVVVVQDDAQLARMLEFGLDTAGVTHRTFATGTDAVDALLRMDHGDQQPIVLLDIDLPGLDGHSVHERLASERPGEFGVVFMTSHAAETAQLRAYRAGALDFVVKPVSLRVLLAKLPMWQRLAAAA